MWFYLHKFRETYCRQQTLTSKMMTMMIWNLLTFRQIWTRPVCVFVAVGHALYVWWVRLDTPPEWLSLATVWVSPTRPLRPVPGLLENKCHVISCPDDGVIPPLTCFFICWPHESFSLLWLPEKVKTTRTQKICDRAAPGQLNINWLVCFKDFFLHNTVELSPSKGLGRHLESNHSANVNC